MNKERLLEKGVSRKFENGEVLFEVASLHEHYEGITIYESDIVDGYVRVLDIVGDDIRELEFVIEEPIITNLVAGVNDDGLPVWVNPPLEVEVTQEALDENPQLVAEGIEVGEILTVDAEVVTGENVIEGELSTEV